MDKIKKNKFEQSNSIKDKKKKLNIKNKVNSKINIETIQNDLKKAKDDNLRHLAEIDNLRKRYEKEREDTFNYAITEFASEIILVLDNFTRVKTSISLINKEDKSNPITDEEISNLLKNKGYKVARRTVAKYREQLEIPISRMRKEL